MSAIIEPKVNFQIVPIEQLAAIQEQKVLIVGQKMAAGSADSHELITNIPNDGSEDDLFGTQSIIAAMIKEFKAINKRTRLDAIPLDDNPAGATCNATVQFDSTPSQNGYFKVIIGSAKKYVYTVNFSTTDTTSTMAAALDAAISANPAVPFYTGVVTNVVTIYLHNKGQVGKDWTIQTETNIPNLSYIVGAFEAFGGQNPLLTNIFDVIGQIRYQTIIWPSVYETLELQSLLDNRFNADNEILDGIGLQSASGTLAELKSYAVQNSQNLCLIANRTISRINPTKVLKGTAIVEIPDLIACQVGAIRALRLTEGAPISQYLSTVASRDQYGGISTASLPYFNTLLPNIEIPAGQDLWTQEEQDELKDYGLSLIGPDPNFEKIIMGEFVTTYLRDQYGTIDNSYKYLNTIDTISHIREFFYQNCRIRYSQTRITEGDLIPGRDMANAGTIRAFLNELYVALTDTTLVQAGSEAINDFNQNLIISIDVSTGTATIDCAPLLTTQLRAILGTIRINFGG